MTLREQIEALEPEHDERAPGWYFDGWNEAHAAILDIIDRHRCIPDRDALARALAAVPGEFDEFSDERLADAIIAALEKP